MYDTFNELFGNINADSIKEALPKISLYNDIIARYVEEINLKYGITLSHTQLEATEIGHWADIPSGHKKQGPIWSAPTTTYLITTTRNTTNAELTTT